MKQDTIYSDAPDEIKNSLNLAKDISDFLPPPELLIPKEETQKITIAVSKKSLDFFKDFSKKNHIPYQQLMRKVLDSYTNFYS